MRRYKAKCVKTRCLQEGVGQLEAWSQDFRGRGRPPANILIPLERLLIAWQSFYIMKLCSKLFVLYCRNCPNDDKFRYFIPILRKLGGVEPWLMACWKARVEFLLSVIELLFLSLAVEALQGKLVKTRCLQEGVGQFEPRLQEEGVIPLPTC